MKKKIKISKREIYCLCMAFSCFILIIGGILNLKVINSNNCLMPVYNFPMADSSDTHFSFVNKTEISYWYLSDIINLKFTIISVGDILAMVGYAMLLFFCFKYTSNRILERRKLNKIPIS